MPVAKLSIDLEARIANLEAGFAKSVAVAEDTNKKITVAMSGIQSAAKSAGGAIAGYFSIKAFENLIKGSIDAQDHLNDLAKRAQVTVGEIGGLGFAARQAGSDVDTAAQMLGRLNISIAKAGNGDKTLAPVFQKIGVAVRDSTGALRSGTEVLADVADKFAGYADGPEKAALAQALFQRSWQSIAPLLQDGGQKLRENTEYWRRYSGVTTESAEAADRFNDTLEKLNLLKGRFGNELTSQLLTPLNNLAELWVKNRENADGFKTMAETIATAMKAAATGIAAVVIQLQSFGDQAGISIVKGQRLFESMKNARGLSDPLGLGPLGQSLGLREADAGQDAMTAQAEKLLAARRKQFEDMYRAIWAPPPAAAFESGFSVTNDGKGRAPNVAGSGGTKAKTDAIDGLIHKLQEQVNATIAAQSAMSNLERAEQELATNPKVSKANQGKVDQYLALAKTLDDLHVKFQTVNTDRDRFNLSEARGQDATNEGVRQQGVADLERMHEIFNSGDDAKLERTVMLEAQVREYLRAIGQEDSPRAKQALEALWGVKVDPALESLDALHVGLNNLSATIDQSLGAGLEGLVTGHFENIGQAFERMLLDMALRATQTKLMESLFGATTSGGGRAGGGWIDAIIGLFGSTGKAAGGSVAPYGVTRVNEHGPETLDVQGKTYLMNGSNWAKVNPAQAGATVRGGDTYVFQTGVSRNEIAALIPQLKKSIKAELRDEQRRPGYSGA